MNQSPIETGLSTRQPSDKTLMEQIRKELWPVAQQILRTLNSVLRVAPLDVTADEDLDGIDDFIKVDASGGNVALSLPSPDTWKRSITVIKTDASVNTVTISVVASGDQVLTAQWDTATFVPDGSFFYRIGGSPSAFLNQGFSVTQQSADFDIARFTGHSGQTLAAAITGMLDAAPVAGDWAWVSAGSNANLFPVTVDGNGKLINGAATFPLNVPYWAIWIAYDGTEWRTI